MDYSEPRPRLVPERAFPAYAYLPGKFPHPIRDPAGHSYGGGQAGLVGELHADANAFPWGVDLFNHGFYWEAHEAWEPLWRAEDKQSFSRHLLKGLILLAAAGVKLRERKPGAAARHAGRAAALFRKAAGLAPASTAAMLGIRPAVLAVLAEDVAERPPSVGASRSVPEVVFPVILGGEQSSIPEGWS